jgi:hypothetical protein
MRVQLASLVSSEAFDLTLYLISGITTADFSDFSIPLGSIASSGITTGSTPVDYWIDIDPVASLAMMESEKYIMIASSVDASGGGTAVSGYVTFTHASPRIEFTF